jgi:hypothetical protein
MMKDQSSFDDAAILILERLVELFSQGHPSLQRIQSFPADVQIPREFQELIKSHSLDRPFDKEFLKGEKDEIQRH